MALAWMAMKGKGKGKRIGAEGTTPSPKPSEPELLKSNTRDYSSLVSPNRVSALRKPKKFDQWL